LQAEAKRRSAAGQREIAGRIEKLAEKLPAEWSTLAETDGWRESLEPLSREDIIGWMSEAGVDWSKSPSLDQVTWLSILMPIVQKHDIELTTPVLNELAADLCEKHATAVRELLKRDAANDGESFAGLLLILHAETLHGLTELADGQDKLSAELAETGDRLDDVLPKLLETGDAVKASADAMIAKHEEYFQRSEECFIVWQQSVAAWSDILPTLGRIEGKLDEHIRNNDLGHSTTHEKLDAVSEKFESHKSQPVQVESHHHVHLNGSPVSDAPSAPAGVSDADALAAAIRARDFDDSASFVARKKELGKLSRWFLPAKPEASTKTTGGKRARKPKGPVQVVVLTGPTGRGKSRLIDRFVVEHWMKHEQFASPEAVRLRLNVVNEQTSEEQVSTLLAQLAAKLRLDSAGGSLEDRLAAIGRWLNQPGTLVVIENVDSSAATTAVAQVVTGLQKLSQSVRFLITSWSESFGAAHRWQRLPIDALPVKDGLSLFRDEMNGRRFRECGEEALRTLVGNLDGLPLGIYLAAKWLESRDDATLADYWAQLLQRGMDLRLKGDLHPTLHAQFELSMQVLGFELASTGADSQSLLNALHDLSQAPACGVGDRLGAAITSLDPAAYALLIDEARDLYLVDVSRQAPVDWSCGTDTSSRQTRRVVRLRPLFANWLRLRAANGDGTERMAQWILHRLPRPMKDDPRLVERPGPWQDLQEERDALIEWLPHVPDRHVFDALRAGDDFAFSLGPGDAWSLLCDRAGAIASTDDQRSLQLKVQSHVAYRWAGTSDGDMDRARRLCEEKLNFEQHRQCHHEIGEAATTLGDVLAQCGHLDEARHQWQHALEAFDEAGSILDAAYVHGRIGSLLAQQGEPDAALKIWRTRELPVYIAEGDVHQQAVTQGMIADVLSARGELDDSLRIFREEVLPAFQRLGDVHGKAITQGKIADVLQARGELDEALRIRREEELPVYERLGDVREKAVTQGKIADVLQARGELDEALRIRREEELPVYERLGDVRAKAVTQVSQDR
jgi:tetratricopeptide (TPR) repeat protein